MPLYVLDMNSEDYAVKVKVRQRQMTSSDILAM